MKVITLAEETVINGQLCRKGQLVQVEDGFDTNVKRVVAEPKEMEEKLKGERLKVKNIEERVKSERIKEKEDKEKEERLKAEKEKKEPKVKENGKAK